MKGHPPATLAPHGHPASTTRIVNALAQRRAAWRAFAIAAAATLFVTIYSLSELNQLIQTGNPGASRIDWREVAERAVQHAEHLPHLPHLSSSKGELSSFLSRLLRLVACVYRCRSVVHCSLVLRSARRECASVDRRSYADLFDRVVFFLAPPIRAIAAMASPLSKPTRRRLFRLFFCPTHDRRDQQQASAHTGDRRDRQQRQQRSCRRRRRRQRPTTGGGGGGGNSCRRRGRGGRGGGRAARAPAEGGVPRDGEH